VTNATFASAFHANIFDLPALRNCRRVQSTVDHRDHRQQLQLLVADDGDFYCADCWESQTLR